MRNVRWTIPAIEDLNTIEEYIAKDSPERAADFVDRLLKLGDSLEDDAVCLRGTPAPWTDDENIRELYYNHYTLVYEVAGDAVLVHEVYNQNKIHLHFGKRRY